MRYVKAGKRRKGYIGVSRQALRSLWGDYCYLCGLVMYFESKYRDHPRYATLEHVIPRSQGGGKTWDNIKLACRECNNDKKDMSWAEYLEVRAQRELEELEALLRDAEEQNEE